MGSCLVAQQSHTSAMSSTFDAVTLSQRLCAVLAGIPFCLLHDSFGFIKLDHAVVGSAARSRDLLLMLMLSCMPDPVLSWD